MFNIDFSISFCHGEKSRIRFPMCCDVSTLTLSYCVIINHLVRNFCFESAKNNLFSYSALASVSWRVFFFKCIEWFWLIRFTILHQSMVYTRIMRQPIILSKRPKSIVSSIFYDALTLCFASNSNNSVWRSDYSCVPHIQHMCTNTISRLLWNDVFK